MEDTIWSLPEVRNWERNICQGLDKYFWDEAIYHCTKILNSFSPYMRVCVELRIEKKSVKQIARLLKRSQKSVEITLGRAKKRLLRAIF